MNREKTESAAFDDQQPIGPTTAGLTLLLAALWGGTPVAVSYSVDELPPVAVAGIRFALASVFMLLWCRFERCSLRLRPGQLKPAMIMGLLLFFQISLFTVGIAKTSSSHSTILINTYIFWVAGIEHFVTRAIRLNTLKLAGLLFAAIGGLIVLVVSEGRADDLNLDPATRVGDLIVVGSAFLLGIKIVYTKQAARIVEPGKLIFWHDVIGVALFATWSLTFEETSLQGIHATTVMGLLYQGVVVAGFCFALQAHLLKRHSASKISVFSIASPLFGIFLAWIFRGDYLSPWLIASAACVAVGILIVNFEPGYAESRGQGGSEKRKGTADERRSN